MPSTNEMISFKYGLQANYDLIEEKDLNAVYFTTDTQRMFVGETEYTRPVQHGTSLPSGFLPPESFFYHETEKALYYSKEGTSWEACSNFYVHPTFTAKVVGANTAGAVNFGGSIKIPKITVNEQGHVSAAEDITVTLPAKPAETPVTVNVTGTGNAVTTATVTDHAITMTKGETFATKDELDGVEAIANAAMPKAGGAFTGAVTVQAPTANMNPATKKYVDDIVGGITDFDIDSNGGDGYATLAALKQAHPTGTKGTFYLVVNPEAEADNAFVEYFWTGTAYEMAGKFGSVDTSDLATKTELNTGLSGKVDKTTTVNGQALSGNVNITTITGNAGTATKLASGKTIALSGAVTGTATAFDGSANITIPTTAVDGSKVTGTVPQAGKTTGSLTINGTEFDGSEDVTITTPDTDTTYTFANGSAGNFTVTPKNGSAQTVSIGKPATAGAADTAAKLATARAITLTGDATGTANFDGSAAASIAVSVNHADAADTATNATNATNATKATQDASGNVITTTYATKSEVQAASLKWGSF